MRSSRVLASISLIGLLGCDDDRPPEVLPEGPSHGGDGSGSPNGGGLDASVRIDAKSPALEPDAAPQNPPLDAATGPSLAEKIARGKYLTNVIYPCTGCHTPRAAPDKFLGGVDCWSDSVASDSDAGCLSSKNLTNHETGIKNLTDPEVKELFLHGKRPDGKALHPQMPYALLGNIREQDADAIVAYLRSLPPIDHRVAANQPPFDMPPELPAPGWPVELIPLPRPDYPEQAAALRGRYLAGNFGGCMDCHTPRSMTGAQLRERAFQGGRKQGDALSPNLTPDPSGTFGYSVEDIVRAIKRGEDPNQNYSRLCPPMPSGPMGAYGAMEDSDARDIAHYLLSLPPVENVIAVDCQVVTDAGTNTSVGMDAGAGDGG